MMLGALLDRQRQLRLVQAWAELPADELSADWELVDRDPERFAKVSIEFGTLSWPEDCLDMAPEPLYEKASQNQVSPASAA